MSSANAKYPLGTVAIYGPTDKLATKIVASVYPTKQKEPTAIKKWNSIAQDIREDTVVQADLSAFLKEHHVAHAVVTEEIAGCPHEPGIDYPSGNPCPFCPFWAHRLRRPKAVPSIASSRNDPCPCGSGKKYKKCCAI